jgi:hypothetical protein
MVNKERYIFWKKEEEKLEGFLKSDANYEKLKSWAVNYQVQSAFFSGNSGYSNQLIRTIINPWIYWTLYKLEFKALLPLLVITLLRVSWQNKETNGFGPLKKPNNIMAWK